MTRVTAVGTYIFAGGFTLGVKRAGFDVRAQLEDGPYGVETTRYNHPGLPVFTVPDQWPLRALADDGIDFVYGNPPCAPFSNSGVSTKKVGLMDNWWRTDPRAECVTRMFKVLEVVRPKVWAWESVQPALTRGKDLVAELTLVAKTLGYRASYVLIDAVHLGVPQRRRRVFVVFHNIEIDWIYPPAGKYLEGWYEGGIELRDTPATVAEAWEPILSGRRPDPELANGVVPRHCLSQYNNNDILDRLQPGGSLKKLWESENPPETRTLNAQGKVKGRPGFLYKRLAYDGQSPTLTGSASKTFHPELDRYITVLEKQLICGYPEDYVFVGSPINKLAQIAQAVMPPVGEWLARNVNVAIHANRPVTNLEAQVVDLEGFWNQVARPAKVREPRPEKVMTGATIMAVPAEPVPLRYPAQSSILPLWTQYNGPTAIAKALIAEGASDAEILATTAAAIKGAKVAEVKWPHLFTKTDLARLRARLLQKENV